MKERWYFKGQQVEVVSYYKYLGIIFSCRLQWYMATKTLAQQARKVLFSLLKATKKTGMLTYDAFFKLFDTMILSIFTYGSEIWGHEQYETLERIQYMACRSFLGVSSNSPNVSVLGECGRYPIYLYTAKRCVKYWAKLLNMPNNRYPRKCYDMLYYIERSGVRSKSTWVKSVENLLILANMHDVWENQEVRNVNNFVKTFVNNFKEYLFLNWRSELCSMDKLSSYRNFKVSLDTEKYLFILKLPVHIQMMARFRCSSHYLRIETDRKYSIERSQRVCLFCDSSELEDEYHCLPFCPFFIHLREKYVPRDYFEPPNEQKCLALMTSDVTDIIQRLAAYVFHAMKLRKEVHEIANICNR